MKKSCYLCSYTEHSIRPGKVRDVASLEILECKNCGLVSLSNSSVPDSFYEESGMHGSEPTNIEEWLRELERDDNRRIKYLGDSIVNKDILDFGCGPGGFIFKAQNKAKQIIGIELETRLASHYAENGIKVLSGFWDLPEDKKFDLITAFHVVEHLENPATILREMSQRLKFNGRIIIEIPSANDALLTYYKNKPFSEFTYWSCHLFLFNPANLQILAKMSGLNLEYVNHVQRYPLSNHLHWLSEGAPGGHHKWSVLDSDELSSAYEAKLASLGLTDTLIACFSA
jgi:SAM-dependent methyltransferase